MDDTEKNTGGTSFSIGVSTDLKDKIENGYPQHYLFTKDELIDARRRALKNTEDFPKSSLIKWFKNLF